MPRRSENISVDSGLLIEVGREDLQPDGVDGGDVPHVDILGVDQLGVHNVGRVLHGVENTFRVDLQGNVSSDRFIKAGMMEIGCVRKQSSHDRLQDCFLVMTTDHGNLEPPENFEKLFPQLSGPGQGFISEVVSGAPVLVLPKLDEGVIDIEQSHQVALGHLELPLGDPELVVLPRAGGQEDVLDLQHGDDGDDLLAAAQLSRTDEHFREAGVDGEL